MPSKNVFPLVLVLSLILVPAGSALAGNAPLPQGPNTFTGASPSTKARGSFTRASRCRWFTLRISTSNVVASACPSRATSNVARPKPVMLRIMRSPCGVETGVAYPARPFERHILLVPRDAFPR